MEMIEDSLLDELLIQIQSGQITVETALARYPQYADELRPLLNAALRLRTAPRPVLSEEASLRIERQWLARIGRTRSEPRPQTSGRNWLFAPRWVTAAFVLVVITIMVGTSAVAASSALPGEPLYEVKQLAEHVQFLVTPPDSVPALHLEFAQRRLQEMEALAKRGEVDAKTIESSEAETRAAIKSASALPPTAQSELLKKVVVLTDRQETVLRNAMAQSPNVSPDKLAQALDAAASLHQQAINELKGIATPTWSAGATPTPAIPISTVTPTVQLATMTSAAGSSAETSEPSPTCNAPTGCTPSPRIGTTPPMPAKTADHHKVTPPGQVRTPGPRGTPGGPAGDNQDNGDRAKNTPQQ